MAGTQKTSQFTAATVANPTDEVPLLQGGTLKRVQVKTLVGNPDVGWIATGESWSFSSWNSTLHVGVITVPSDATTKYAVGMWVRIAQTTGGTKYGKIIAVAATTLSVNFPNSITLNNEAITTPVYSPLARPTGSPDDSTFVHSMTNTGTGGGTLKFRYDNGIKEVWGVTGSYSNGAGTQIAHGITFPTGFFSQNPAYATCSGYVLTTNAAQFFFVQDTVLTTNTAMAVMATAAFAGQGIAYRVVGV